MEGNGKLTKKEVITIMRSYFPVSYSKAEEVVNGFNQWESSDFIDYETLVDPTTGLMEYFKEQFPIQVDREPSGNL